MKCYQGGCLLMGEHEILIVSIKVLRKNAMKVFTND